MDDRQWAEEIAEKIHKKEQLVVMRNRQKIPYTATGGR